MLGSAIWLAAALSVLTYMLPPAFAQNAKPDASQTDALSNLQMEMSVCIAYYNFMKTCSPDQMQADTAAKVDPVIQLLTKRAFVVGTSIGMTNDAMLARQQMSYTDQTQIIQNSCTNFSSLYVRHGERCKRVVENSDSILREYMDGSK